MDPNVQIYAGPFLQDVWIRGWWLQRYIGDVLARFHTERRKNHFEYQGYPPGGLTWNPKMEVGKMIFLFNWVIFRFHVNFQGCTLLETHISFFLQDSWVDFPLKPRWDRFPGFCGDLVPINRGVWGARSSKQNQSQWDPTWLLFVFWRVFLWKSGVAYGVGKFYN